MSDAPATPPQERSLARVAFAGAAWLSVLNGLAGAVLLLLNIWLNRALPDAPVAMGTWNLVLRFLLMTSLIFDGGIPAAIMQRAEISRGALAALSWLQVSLGVAGGAILFLFARPIASLWAEYPQQDLVTCLRLAAPALFFIALGLPPKAVLQRDLKFRLVAIIESSAALALVVVAFVAAPRFGAVALVAGMLARHGIETLLYWAFSSLSPAILVTRFNLAEVGERLRFGASMAGQSLLGTLMRQGDGLLVGFVAGPVAGGLYGQLQTLVVQPYAKLTLHVARAAFPTFAKAKDDPERLLRGLARMLRLVALVVFPTLAGMAAVAPRLLHLLLGDQYLPHLPLAVPAFQVLCLGALLFTYGFSTGVTMNAIGLSRPMLLRQAAGLAAVVLLMVAGAPWGLLGTSVGRAAASGIIAALYLGLARRVVGLTWSRSAEALREAVPASLACFLVAAGVGLLADHFVPASDPLAAGAHSTRALLMILVAQSAAGAGAYGLGLLARGVSLRQEWAALRSRA